MFEQPRKGYVDVKVSKLGRTDQSRHASWLLAKLASCSEYELAERVDLLQDICKNDVSVRNELGPIICLVRQKTKYIESKARVRVLKALFSFQFNVLLPSKRH